MAHKALTCCLGVMVAGGLAAAPLPPAESSADARTEARVLLASGQLLDRAGRPASGVRVRVAAWPSAPGESVLPRVLGSDVTSDEGSFAVRGALPRGSAYVGAGGAVELEVSSVVGGHTVFHRHSLQVAGGAQRMAPVSPPPRVRLQVGRGDTSSEQQARLAPIDVERAAVAGRRWSEAGRARGPTACDNGDTMSSWSLTGRKARRMLPVFRITSRKRSVMTYDWRRTHETTTTVAYTGGSGDYAGGFTASRSNRSDLSLRWRAKRVSRLLRVEWEFREFQRLCASEDPPYLYGLDLYQWVPWKHTSGSDQVRSAPPWKCGRRSTVRMGARKTIMARESTVTYKGFFSIAGVALADTQRTKSDEQVLTVRRRSGREAPSICGSSGEYPYEANRVKERR